MVPAASRLATIELSSWSPNTDRTPDIEENVAVVAMVVVLPRFGPLGRMLSRGPHDRLEAGLERALNSLKRPC
jgi:hypothetical protein